jgi:hypothetical protein
MDARVHAGWRANRHNTSREHRRTAQRRTIQLLFRSSTLRGAIKRAAGSCVNPKTRM